MKRIILLPLLACALALAATARAEQTGTGHYASGEFADFSSALPNTEGFTFINAFLCYDNGRAGGDKGLPFGGSIGTDIKAQSYAEVPVAIYTTPFELLGAHPAVGLGVPYMWVEVKAGATIDTRRGDRSVNVSDSTSGVGDIQLMPFMLGWTNADFKYGFIGNVWAPTGEYDKTHLANVGLGYWTFTPMGYFSWLSSNIGTEFTVFTGVDFNTKNTDADYQSGDIFHVDATLAQHLPLAGGFAGVGATAFYLKQFTGDSGSGATLGSFEVESYGVGPTFSYVHKVGKANVVLDASWLPQLHVENTTKGNWIWVKLVVAF